MGEFTQDWFCFLTQLKLIFFFFFGRESCEQQCCVKNLLILLVNGNEMYPSAYEYTEEFALENTKYIQCDLCWLYLTASFLHIDVFLIGNVVHWNRLSKSCEKMFCFYYLHHGDFVFTAFDFVRLLFYWLRYNFFFFLRVHWFSRKSLER